MHPLSSRAARTLLAAAAVAAFSAATPAHAQTDLTEAEIQQITCVSLQLPIVRTLIDAGNGPLLVVSGRELGHLRAPSRPCGSEASLPRGASEFRFIQPHSAPALYGERGKHGAVLVDLPPRG